MPKVVCNSSPLIHLARNGRLELLRDFFEQVLIPEEVYKECVIDGKGRDDAKSNQGCIMDSGEKDRKY